MNFYPKWQKFETSKWGATDGKGDMQVAGASSRYGGWLEEQLYVENDEGSFWFWARPRGWEGRERERGSVRGKKERMKKRKERGKKKEKERRKKEKKNKKYYLSFYNVE